MDIQQYKKRKNPSTHNITNLALLLYLSSVDHASFLHEKLNQRLVRKRSFPNIQTAGRHFKW